MNSNGPLSVEVKPGEDKEYALRRFKQKLKRDDRFVEMRRHDYFIKPSAKKRLKRRRKKLSDGRDMQDLS